MRITTTSIRARLAVMLSRGFAPGPPPSAFGFGLLPSCSPSSLAPLARSIAAAALLFGAASANAEGYASAGQLEMGGVFQVANITEKPDNGEESTATAIQISPQAGYWLTSWFELLGTMDIRQTTVENGDFSRTSVGLGAGPGLFLKLGNARLGPYALAHVNTDTVSVFGTADDVTTSGPGATLGVQFKLPVAGGGVVVLGAAADYSNVKISTEAAQAQGTSTSFGTSVGFLGYF